MKRFLTLFAVPRPMGPLPQCGKIGALRLVATKEPSTSRSMATSPGPDRPADPRSALVLDGGSGLVSETTIEVDGQVLPLPTSPVSVPTDTFSTSSEFSRDNDNLVRSTMKSPLESGTLTSSMMFCRTYE